MKLFRKEYIINFHATKLDFEKLDFDTIEELYDEEFDAFKIDSLVYFNTVFAKFKKTPLEDSLLLKFELPKRSRNLLGISVVLLFSMVISFTFIDDYESNIAFRYLVYLFPIFIIVGVAIYHFEFLKGAKNFIKEITLFDEK